MQSRCLIEIEKDGIKQTHYLSKERFTIGRSPQADLCIDDKSISRLHLEVQIVNEQIYVKDLRSSNGVVADGKRVSPETSVLVKSGVEIQLSQERKLRLFYPATAQRPLDRPTGLSAITNHPLPETRPTQVSQVSQLSQVSNLDARPRAPNTMHLEVEALQGKARVAKEEFDRVQSQLRQAQEDLAKARDQVWGSRDEHEKNQSKLREAREELDKVIGTIKTKNEEADRIQNEIKTLNLDLTKATEVAERSRAQIEMEIQGLKTKLEMQESGVKVQILKVQGEIEEATTRKLLIEREWSLIKADMAEAESKIQKIEVEAMEARKMADDAKRDCEQTRVEAESWLRKCDELEQKAEIAQGNLESSRKENERLETLKRQAELQAKETVSKSELHAKEAVSKAELKAKETLASAESQAQEIVTKAEQKSKETIAITEAETRARIEKEWSEKERKLKSKLEEEEATAQQRISEKLKKGESEALQAAERAHLDLSNLRLKEMKALKEAKEAWEKERKTHLNWQISEIERSLTDLLRSKFLQDPTQGEATVKEFSNPLKAILELKERAGNPFDAHVPVNPVMQKKTREFWIRAGTKTGGAIALLFVFTYFPIFSSIKGLVVTKIKDAPQVEREHMKKVQAERQAAIAFVPKRDRVYLDSYTENFIHLESYIDLKTRPEVQKEWVLAVNDFFINEIKIGDRAVVEFISTETLLVTKLNEAFNSITKENEKSGREKMRSIEAEATATFKKILKKSEHYTSFRNFEKRFYFNQLANLPVRDIASQEE